ncbi:hypothetical protein [Phenylobacterium sp.]|uniref:hypothetical protein n=1 Tax=Phenylobacterium sp. TaxID=1871053 RepID=UPI0025F067A5|nr:hypothetical protein [Phenylobacterium sp.]
MLSPALEGVFANAAAPQKAALILLVATLPGMLIAATLAVRGGRGAEAWRRTVADLRTAGPAVGLLVASLNGFHMGETIARLPFDPTLKQVAPGIFEISVFVSLGAAVGLLAQVAHTAIGLLARRRQTL